MSGGMRGEEARAAARLAELTLRVERLLAAVYGAYAFFAFGMGVTASLLLSLGLVQAGIAGYGIVWVFVAFGLLAAMVLVREVVGPIQRYLALRGYSDEGRSPLLMVAVFTVLMTAGYAIIYFVEPRLMPVAWYPSLAAIMLAFSLLCERGSDCRLSFLASSLVMTAAMPLVLYYNSNLLATGFMTLSHLAAGSLLLYRASRTLG
ncbi:MAG: hypothetical protein GSR78_03890 [Desulfurococcales archaeon]|nr:hypothetical protein [Desulfurococcales archaeon]